MPELIAAILPLLVAIVGVRKWQKYESAWQRKVGLWYMKGVVFEGGSVTDLLRRDTMFRRMINRGHVVEGIDTDPGAKKLLERRIELAQELVRQADLYFRERNGRQPSFKEIDRILIDWLGPSKNSLYSQTMNDLYDSGLAEMVAKIELEELGEIGKQLFRYYSGKIASQELDANKIQVKILELFEMIKEWKLLAERNNALADVQQINALQKNIEDHFG